MKTNAFNKAKIIKRIFTFSVIVVLISCVVTLSCSHSQETSLLAQTNASSEADLLEVLILPSGKKIEATLTGHYKFNSSSKEYTQILHKLQESPCQLSRSNIFKSLIGGSNTITADSDIKNALHILLSLNGERTDAIVLNGSNEVLVNNKVYSIDESYSNEEERILMDDLLTIVLQNDVYPIDENPLQNS